MNLVVLVSKFFSVAFFLGLEQMAWVGGMKMIFKYQVINFGHNLSKRGTYVLSLLQFSISDQVKNIARPSYFS